MDFAIVGRICENEFSRRVTGLHPSPESVWFALAIMAAIAHLNGRVTHAVVSIIDRETKCRYSAIDSVITVFIL